MEDETPNGEPSGQSGGINAEGSTSIGGNAVGRDSITQTSTTTTNTTVTEGGPVARYAVVGVVIIAALAIVIIALLAFQDRPILPTATPTASITVTPSPSQAPSSTASPVPPPPTATQTEAPTATATVPPSPTNSPLPPTETPSPSPPPTEEATIPSGPTETATATPTPSVTATETATLTPTPSPLATFALPLYDDFASSCLKKEKWMLDWVWQSPLPTPGAPVCLDTRPQFMAPDEGLIVFLDSTVAITSSMSHALTSAQLGYYKQVEVVFALNQVDVFTDTRTTYLSAGVSVLLARPADADLEIRLQGSNAGGKFVYQITSLLSLKDGGYVGGGKLPYQPGQLVTAAFRVKGNKLTAYVDGQPIAGPYSILSEPSVVNIGYHVDPQTAIDGIFSEVRILQMAASEFPTPPPVLLPSRLTTTEPPPLTSTPTPP